MAALQIAQPQIAQPQFVQVLMPNGQIQQVQVVQPHEAQQMLNLAGFPGMQRATQIQEKANVTAGSTGTQCFNIKPKVTYLITYCLFFRKLNFAKKIHQCFHEFFSAHLVVFISIYNFMKYSLFFFVSSTLK